MKHQILTYCLSILVFGSLPACSVTEENPIDSIAASNYFQTYKDVEAAVVGAYSVLTVPNSFGRFRVLVPELSAKSIVHRVAQFEFAHFSNNNIIPENILLLPLWSEMYRGIMRANDIIAAVPTLDTRNQELSRNFLGEAYFLRAFFYFDLARMFGGVPLIISPTNNIDLNAVRVPRADLQKVYSQIINDLLEAERLLPETYAVRNQIRGRATKTTARAYLAKVYFYQQNYMACLTKSSEALSNTANYSLVSLETLYSTNDNPEAIFEVFFVTDAVSIQLLPSSSPFNGTGEYFVTESLRRTYEPQDKRLNYMIQSGNNWFAAKARKIRAATADPVYCLRVAELHLIRAEALARTAGSVSPQAVAALNLVRERAGLPPLQTTDFTSLDNFIELVLIEKRRELAFETGEFWFDAIRAGLAAKLLGVTNPNAYLYPIPSAELIRNPNLTQNAGY